MCESRERKAAAIQDSIRQILYHEWDPIGVAGLAPEDEYDHYIAAVYKILTGSRSEDEIVDYFQRSETERMGLSWAAATEELRSIARRLLELDVKL